MFENENLYDDQFNIELKRFEQMIQTGESFFFDSETLEELIDYYLNKNEFNISLLAVEHGLKLFPENIIFKIKKAQIFSSNGRLKESLLILQILEKFESNNIDVFVTMANVFSQLRDHKNAIKYYQKAISINEIYNNGVEEVIDVLLDLSLEYENIQDFNKAIDTLEKLLEVYPNYESAIYEVAYCYERIGDFDKCIDYYNKYIDNNPYSFTAWYNLGNIYFLKKESQKALWAYEYSLIINEEFSSAHFNMGNTYMQLNDYYKAIESYEKCLELDSEDALTLCYLGEAYERLENYTKALFYYEKSKTINPELPDVWIGIGIVKELEGKKNESINYFKQAVKLSPNNLNYLFLLGESLFKVERYVEAELVLEQIINKENDNNEVILLLAQIKKDYNVVEAIMFLLEQNSVKPLSLQNMIFLSSLYWENNQKMEALDIFKNQFIINANKSVKYLLLYLPESINYSEFNNIINS